MIKSYIDKSSIKKRIKVLGRDISRHHINEPITLVGVMNGSLLFFADLIKQIEIPINIETVKISSYNGKNQKKPIMEYCCSNNINSHHIIIVDDIYDTGVTLKYVEKELMIYGPLSIEFCVLLNKNVKKKEPLNIKYEGFSVKDHFLVGYGLDHKGLYRNLPFVGILK